MNKMGRHAWAYTLFTLPTLLIFATFFLYPMLMSLRYGFTEWNGISPAIFNGLDNFVAAFQDPYFWIAVRNNMYFISFSIGIQIPIILAIALLVSQIKRWVGFYKALIFLPTILSTAVVGVLWEFIYHPQAGLLNQVLEAVGLSSWQHAWLADGATAMLAILITNAWQWMGFYVVLVVSAIYAIPKHLVEAAQLDGAGSLRQAWFVILPLLRPVIVVMMLLSITGGMKAMDIVVVMTGGNPYGITEVMASYMIKKAYRIGEYGYANSIAVLILFFTAILTSVFGWFTRNQEEVRL
ncbi:Diacetylchitobiose uptake system permease protein NgcF [Paenibacillus allorhizoplanae]|uniref:Diacetylchitobiose uptake system permease protein NgcF n=1 Tax=Paenibacillus allorhizoplanae TaxID=2905648 RepID=A0ABM9CH45_9BACL|nr:sugar ABC transporter permease [Paenibacillus allorhizoplanae]CAH1214314.1 Diacetylchitobiose uptake system permease protein NgcF [Paenibacillus allorhizoplanae]